MEIIQAIAGFFVVIAVVSAVIQVLVSYSLQVIAEKNELPDFAAFIAWIPLLNIYPFIKVGGGDFKRLILGSLGLIVGIAVVAGGAAAAGFAGAGTAVAAIVFALVTIIYSARIAMGTAERRGLSKWLGLLIFVPLGGLFLYPYVAFHDGFKAPNKFGLVLGLLLAFGPLPGQIAIVESLTEQAQEIAQTDLGDGATIADAMGGLGATLEIGAQLAMLDAMDPRDQDEAGTMVEVLADVQQKLEANSDSIGPEAYEEFKQLTAVQSDRLRASGQGPAPEGIVTAAGAGQAMAAAPISLISPPLTAGTPRDGDQGFEVPVDPACPAGTAQRTTDQAEGAREWCEKVGVDAGIKHGWMTEYHANGAAAAAGEYRDGLRIGVWTRYFDNGVKRVQAEFVDGLQDGVLISWGPDGTKIYEKYFSQGAPASR